MMSDHMISEHTNELAVFLLFTTICVGNWTCLHAFPSPENVVLTVDKNPAHVGENVKLTCKVPDGPPIIWITIKANNSLTSDYSTCYHDGKFISGGGLGGRTFSTCQANLSSGAHWIEVIVRKPIEYTCEVFYNHPPEPIAGFVSARQPLLLEVIGMNNRFRKGAMTNKKTKWNSLVLDCTASQSPPVFRNTSKHSYQNRTPELTCGRPPTELNFRCYEDISRYEIFVNNTGLAICEKPFATLKFHNESDVKAMKVDMSASTCSVCPNPKPGKDYSAFTLVPSNDENHYDWFFENFKKQHNKTPETLPEPNRSTNWLNQLAIPIVIVSVAVATLICE